MEKWLKKNPQDPQVRHVLRRFIGFSDGAEDLLSKIEDLLLEEFVPKDIPLHRWAAETAELMGDYPKAREYYIKGAKASSLLEDALDMEMSALEIDLLLGEVEEAEVRITELLPQCSLNPPLLSRGLLILSRILHHREKDSQSWKAARGMMEYHDSPKALLWIAALAPESDKGSYLEKLSEKYPMSPQALVSQGRRLVKTDPLSLGWGGLSPKKNR